MAVNLQTIKDIRNYLEKELSRSYDERELASISDLIISKLFKLNGISYLLQKNRKKIDRLKTEKIIIYCRELKKGKPIQYVLGETIFYDCVIKVNPGVMIPRPETEELVDLIVKENTGFKGRIIDIGTGSGCIAVALATRFPSARITGIDISGPALRTAKVNAKKNNVAVSFMKADIFNIGRDEIQNADMIVSNPPYIMDSEKQCMKKNVLDFEPQIALFVPDNDPLKFYHAILDLANHILNPGGSVYFEINEAMDNIVRCLLEEYEYQGIKIIKDINGKDRIAKGIKNG